MNPRSTEPSAVAVPRLAVRTRWPWWLALAALFILLVGAQWVCLASDSTFLSVLYDEFLYVEMAIEIAEGRAPTMNGAGPPRYPPLYSAVLAPVPLALAGEYPVFHLARILNVLLYTMALFAAFALARRLVSPGAALLAGVAAVIGPGLILPGYLLSENLFIPLTLFYLLAVVRALEKPSVPRHVLAGLLAAACAWTKVTAVVPVAMASAYILLGSGLERRERVRALAWQLLVCALLTVPLLTHVLPGVVGSTAEEARPAAAIGAARLLASGVEHTLAPLWTFGPLLAALAIAGLAARLRSRPGAGERGLLVIGAGTIAVTFLVAAIWIALARPEEARVEERYLIPVYPLLFILAVAAIERPPRGWWWVPVFVALAAAAAFVPTYQLDPARLPSWFRQQPGPALVQTAAGEIGLAAARPGLISLWTGLAVVFLMLRGSPWRRVAYAGVLVPGLAFFWVAAGPLRAVQVGTDESTRVELDRVEALLVRHLGPDDYLMFAGDMPVALPFAVAVRHRRRYWHQKTMDPVSWFPGRLDPATGRISLRDGATRPSRVLLITCDGVTRGGTRVDCRGPWRAFRLDEAEPRLFSFLIPEPELLPGREPAPGAKTTRRVFLWPLPPGTSRTFRATPGGPGVELRVRRWAPYLDTPWFALTETIESPVPPIRGEGVHVTLMELGVRGGSVRFAIEQSAANNQPGSPQNQPGSRRAEESK